MVPLPKEVIFGLAIKLEKRNEWLKKPGEGLFQQVRRVSARKVVGRRGKVRKQIRSRRAMMYTQM